MNNNLKNKTAAFVNLKDNEFVNMYVKDIMKHKPMTAKDEKRLFSLVNEGKLASAKLEESSEELSKDEIASLNLTVRVGNEAREEILIRNQRFVYATAKRYAQDDEMLPDLLSEGNLGLITAFDTYDVESGNRFCTYAVWYIRRSINAYLTTGNVMINKSNNLKTSSKLPKIQNKFFAENGRYPTNDEIIDIFKNEYHIVLKNESDLYDLRIDSINTCYDDEDERIFENSFDFVAHTSVSSDEVENADGNYNDSQIKYLMSYLDDRERKIISLAYGVCDSEKDYSNIEIGEMLGITSERVRQIKNEAIKKMKSHATEVLAF